MKAEVIQYSLAKYAAKSFLDQTPIFGPLLTLVLGNAPKRLERKDQKQCCTAHANIADLPLRDVKAAKEQWNIVASNVLRKPLLPKKKIIQGGPEEKNGEHFPAAQLSEKRLRPLDVAKNAAPKRAFKGIT